MVGSTGGVTSSNGLGINYVDQWGEKWRTTVMKLYHGSNMEIDKPDLSRSKPFKDFGQGFYLSPGYEQAHALAKQKTDQLQSESHL